MAVKVRKLSSNPIADTLAIKGYNMDYFFATGKYGGVASEENLKDTLNMVSEVSDKIVSMYYTFSGFTCDELDLSSWDLKSLTNATYMCYLSKCKSIKAPKLEIANNLDYAFGGCSELISVDLSSINTSNVESFYSCFKDSPKLESIKLKIGNKATRLTNLCYGCTNLSSVDFSGSDMSNVTDISYIFMHCKKLENIDLSMLNTSKATSFNHMFNDCQSIKSLDLSSFDTSGATSFTGIFTDCSSLISLDLSSFNTSNATDISRMFSGCSSLISLDLSSFNTSKTTNMKDIFNNLTNLTSITFGENFVTTKITVNTNKPKLDTCTSLTTIAIKNKESVIQLSGVLPSSVTDVYVPSNMVENYKNSDYWRNLPDGVVKALPTE